MITRLREACYGPESTSTWILSLVMAAVVLLLSILWATAIEAFGKPMLLISAAVAMLIIFTTVIHWWFFEGE